MRLVHLELQNHLARLQLEACLDKRRQLQPLHSDNNRVRSEVLEVQQQQRQVNQIHYLRILVDHYSMD